MSRSSLSRRDRKGSLAGRLIWRMRLLPPRTLKGMWMWVSASAVAAALLAAPMPALGADECGVVPPGGTATCTAADNPYADGIIYTVDDLTIVLQGAVGAHGTLGVTSTGFISTSGNNSAGIAARSNVSPVTVRANNISTLGDYAYGVYATNAIGGAGAVSVTGTGLITTAGYMSHGVFACSGTGPVTVNVKDVSTVALV